jgi:hypothetical protein
MSKGGGAHANIPGGESRELDQALCLSNTSARQELFLSRLLQPFIESDGEMMLN